LQALERIHLGLGNVNLVSAYLPSIVTGMDLNSMLGHFVRQVVHNSEVQVLFASAEVGRVGLFAVARDMAVVLCVHSGANIEVEAVKELVQVIIVLHSDDIHSAGLLRLAYPLLVIDSLLLAVEEAAAAWTLELPKTWFVYDSASCWEERRKRSSSANDLEGELRRKCLKKLHPSDCSEDHAHLSHWNGIHMIRLAGSLSFYTPAISIRIVLSCCGRGCWDS